jgi:sensor histidine kinase YesM
MRKYWKYHLTLALALIALEFLERYFFNGIEGVLRNFTGRVASLKTTFFSTGILIYILNYKYVCPNFFQVNSILKTLLGISLLIIIFSSVRFLLEEIILYNITGRNNYNIENLTVFRYVGDNYFYAIKPILYSTIIFFVISNKEKRELTFQLEIAKSKAELDLLKSQISPHFLFNTLNSFYVELIDEKPSTANDIHRLSQLLRHVIYDSKNDFISLKKEINFLKDYVHFFRKRYEDNLYVNFNLNGNLEDKKIPTLVLINFIENLFKHGIVDNKDEIAEINISIEDDTLTLYTKNKTNESDKLMNSGIGNKNVKKRLDILYPNQEYSLQFSNKNSCFESTLKLPI